MVLLSVVWEKKKNLEVTKPKFVLQAMNLESLLTSPSGPVVPWHSCHIDHTHSDTGDPTDHMTLGNYALHQQCPVLNPNTEKQTDLVSCLPEKEILDAVRGMMCPLVHCCFWHLKT